MSTSKYIHIDGFLPDGKEISALHHELESQVKGKMLESGWDLSLFDYEYIARQMWRNDNGNHGYKETKELYFPYYTIAFVAKLNKERHETTSKKEFLEEIEHLKSIGEIDADVIVMYN